MKATQWQYLENARTLATAALFQTEKAQTFTV